MRDKRRIVVGTIMGSIILILLSVMIQKSLVNRETDIVVYKANKKIEVGDKISGQDISQIKLKASDDSKDYIKSEEELKGMRVKETIYPNEAINKNRLISESDKDYFNEKNKRKFSIDSAYFDDTFSLAIPKGTVVDILFTNTDDSGKQVETVVQLKNVKVLGRINSDGNLIEDGKPGLAQGVLFESSTNDIIDTTKNQFKGKFKLIQVPLSEEIK